MSAAQDLKKLIGSHNIITPRMMQYLLSHGEVGMFEPAVAKRMIEVMTEPHNRKRGWHPSSLMGCKRAQVFEYIGVSPQNRFTAQQLSLFADGTWRHLRWQTMLLSAGVLTDVEIPVEDETTGLVGSMDGEGVYKGEGFMFELKGIHTLHKDLPYTVHEWQIEAYLMMRPDLAFAVAVYEDKRTQQWAEYRVFRNKARQAALNRRLASLNNHTEQEKLPDVRPDCIKEKGEEWRDCPYAHTCKKLKSWQDAKDQAASEEPF